MSENLDLVRSIFADWERGDHSSAEWADPEVELVIVDGPNPGTWTGLTAMAGIENETLRGRVGTEKYFESLDAAWEELRLAGGEFRDLGDRVLWLGRMEGRGRGNGAPVTSPAASLHDFRGGLIWRTCSFLDHSEALRAAGLSA